MVVPIAMTFVLGDVDPRQRTIVLVLLFWGSFAVLTAAVTYVVFARMDGEQLRNALLWGERHERGLTARMLRNKH
ncbi:hypothetical protein GCM10028815_24520 [Mariniluteicoccus flavus]